MPRIVLLTAPDYVSPNPGDWYADQILLEDHLIAKELEKRGYEVVRVDWSGDLAAYHNDVWVCRAMWDYFHRFDAFESWLSGIRQMQKVYNTPELISWNLDKHYLLDLEKRGVPIAPTVYLRQGQQCHLTVLLEQNNWKKAVFKPAVSGAARETYAFTLEEAQQHESRLNLLLQSENMIVQEFQQNIVDQGEFSLMVFGGTYSHAVLKKAKSGDFRVQDDFGGSVAEYQPSTSEVDFALKAVSACPSEPLYARVDMFYDNQGNPAIGELELIEPELWFRHSPNAASLFASALHARVAETHLANA